MSTFKISPQKRGYLSKARRKSVVSVVLVSAPELQAGSNMSNETHKKMDRSGTSLALIWSKYKNQEEVLLERETSCNVIKEGQREGKLAGRPRGRELPGKR